MDERRLGLDSGKRVNVINDDVARTVDELHISRERNEQLQDELHGARERAEELAREVEVLRHVQALMHSENRQLAEAKEELAEENRELRRRSMDQLGGLDFAHISPVPPPKRARRY